MNAKSIRTLVAALCAAVALHAAAPTAHAFSGDNDGDGFSDALEWYTWGGPGPLTYSATNATSTPESLAVDALFSLTHCTDGLDNDGDGTVDGADPGCVNTDGDLIGGVPADDRLEATFYIAYSDATNAASVPEHWYFDIAFAVSNCSDGIDNDLDGGIDAADPGCLPDWDLDDTPNVYDNETTCGHQGLFYLSGTSCTDGVDNDADGLLDGLDPGCADVDMDGIPDICDGEGWQPNANGLAGADDCYDGLDNNADGFIDANQTACGFCNGAAATITGTAADDVLRGTTGNDVIIAGTGDDVISGGDGNDYVCAGPGNDRLSGGGGSDSLFGGDGDDKLVGGTGADALYGGRNDDKLVGSSDDDFLEGGAGDDKLVGSSGNDTLTDPSGNNRLIGSSGNDSLSAGPGDDFLIGGGDNDVLSDSGGTNKLIGSGGDDMMFGGVNVDVMIGSGGNDIVSGNAGNDDLRGGGGNDTLDGQGDDDALNGGGGTDSCQGNSGTDTASASCEMTFNVP